MGVMSDAFRRRTSSTASHRQPFWMKTEKSHRIYLENPRAAENAAHAKADPSSKINDHGVDNYSYDPDYLDEFALPTGLTERLPAVLQDRVLEWQKAGAAVCTALDRTYISSKKAFQSAYPGFTAVTSTRAVVTPSPPESPLPAAPVIPLEQMRKFALASAKEPQQQEPFGLESPPYTPLDSISTSTSTQDGSPYSYTQDGTPSSRVPDLEKVNYELTPISPFQSSPIPVPNNTTPKGRFPEFSEVSWEYFVNKYAEEIRDCKRSLQRVRGDARKIQVLLAETGETMTAEEKAAVREFRSWWDGGATKGKMDELKVRIEALRVPRLEEVSVGVLGAEEEGVVV